jgi:hypothetical protein
VSAPVSTGPKQDGRFKPGQSGNPAGRVPGSRTKLAESFIAALGADFHKNGVEAIEKLRVTDVAAYIKAVASLIPKEFSLGDGEGGPLQIVIRKMIVADDA